MQSRQFLFLAVSSLSTGCAELVALTHPIDLEAAGLDSLDTGEGDAERPALTGLALDRELTLLRPWRLAEEALEQDWGVAEGLAVQERRSADGVELTLTYDGYRGGPGEGTRSWWGTQVLVWDGDVWISIQSDLAQEDALVDGERQELAWADHWIAGDLDALGPDASGADRGELVFDGLAQLPGGGEVRVYGVTQHTGLCGLEPADQGELILEGEITTTLWHDGDVSCEGCLPWWASDGSEGTECW